MEAEAVFKKYGNKKRVFPRLIIKHLLKNDFLTAKDIQCRLDADYGVQRQ